MSYHQSDEESPLLPRKTRTPIPWFQFSIVMILQLAEPLTSQVISPFIPQVCTILEGGEPVSDA